VKDTSIPLFSTRDKVRKRIEEYCNDRFKVNIIANTFSGTDFSEVDSNFYKVFTRYREGGYDIADYLLNQRQVGATLYVVDDKRLAASLFILKGQLAKQTSNLAGIEKSYRDAVVAQKKYYTLSVLGDYLIEKNRYADALPILKQKMDAPSKQVQLSDSINTYRQLAEIYNNRMDYSHAYNFNFAIYEKKDTISSGDDFQMKFSLFETLDNFGINFTNGPDEQIQYMKQMIDFNNKLAQNHEDSFLLAAVDRSKYPGRIAKLYELKKQNKDSAARYFRMAAQIAFNSSLGTKDPRYLSILKNRYDQYASSGISKRLKLHFLRKQRRRTKRADSISPETKDDLRQYLRFLIRKTKHV